MALSTSNVIVTRSGTGWTVDVTACNLLSDLSIKDFIMLIEGTLEPNSNITKTSQTVLTYNGTSISSSTVEVRRVTPDGRFQNINFADQLSSTVFNEEIDRIIRRSFEYSLNGIGPGSAVTAVAPLNEAFPGTWAGDTVRSRTANRLKEEFDKRGSLAENEDITGTWTADTQTDADNSTKLATTAYADTRVTNALSNSPALGGNPTAPTQADANDSTRIATTAFVKNVLEAFVYPVGSIYINATNATNPGTLLGFGTWVAFGAGRVMVGLDSGDILFDSAEETGGAQTHTLSVAEMPAHTHSVNWVNSPGAAASGALLGTNTGTQSGSTGGGDPHNNIQPYIVVYLWKRTV